MDRLSFPSTLDPIPGSAAERARFAELQARLAALFETAFADRRAARTVVVVPAISIDHEVIARIAGVGHYEERMLCLLLLLRMPRVRVVYVTSMPVPPSIVDYYLHMLPGVPEEHARARLELLACHDPAPESTVTEKLLQRPRLLERLREAVGDPRRASMSCFNVTPAERTLAVQLGIPIYGCDPELAHLGGKSGSRKVFREAGVLLPDGREDLRDHADVADALAELRRERPDLPRAAIKLDFGVSGKGNAVFDFGGCPDGRGAAAWIGAQLPTRTTFEEPSLTWEHFAEKLGRTGGVVEAWVDGTDKRSPSMQGRVDPLGRVALVSTHEQVLGGPTGQVYLGCGFPADERYRHDLQDAGLAVGKVLADRGALGRYAVDFVTIRDGDAWRHYALEINLRKGGTTHTFSILQFLTDGRYQPETGLFLTAEGAPRFSYASDNLHGESYRRLTPEDLLQIVVEEDLHFHGATQVGVFFHLIGALSEVGKLGIVCVERSPDAARQLYDRTVALLDREASRGAEPAGG